MNCIARYSYGFGLIQQGASTKKLFSLLALVMLWILALGYYWLGRRGWGEEFAEFSESSRKRKICDENSFFQIILNRQLYRYLENFHRKYLQMSKLDIQYKKGAYLSFDFIWFIPYSLWMLSISKNRDGGGRGLGR